MADLTDVIGALATLSSKVVELNSLNTDFATADSIPVTITYNGSWPARSTATLRSTRRVFWVGNPGGSPPVGMLENDIWTQGE